MRGIRWQVLVATFFAPVLMALAAAPTGTATASGSGSAPADNPSVRLLASDASGATIELNYHAPTIERLDEPAGRVRVHMDRTVPSMRLGSPELPVERITLGAPHGADVRATAVPGPARDVGRFRVVPTPHVSVETDDSGAQYAAPDFVENRDAYAARGFRPTALAEVTFDGLTRDRRTVTVEVRPVQYDPSTRRLRAYSRVTVRVDFVGGSPSIRGDRVYVGDETGILRSIDWHHRTLPFEKALVKLKFYGWWYGLTNTLANQKGFVWGFSSPGGSPLGTAVATDELVYVPASVGRLYAVDTATGEEVWSFRTSGRLLGAPAVVGETVVLGDERGRLYGLRDSTGEQLWELRGLGGAIATTPVVAGDTIYVATEEGRLLAIR
mgnify:CR=1 FL=1